MIWWQKDHKCQMLSDFFAACTSTAGHVGGPGMSVNWPCCGPRLALQGTLCAHLSINNFLSVGNEY